MKKLLPLLLVPAFSLSLGCGPSLDKQPNTDPEFCNGTSCEQLSKPALSGVFVSGHLGNYRDCPGDGWTEPVVVGSGSEGAAPAEGDIAGDCGAESTNCQPVLNCEDASATINVTNLGEGLAEGVQVDRVELFNDDGDLVATLPVLEVMEAGAAFDGEISTDESVTLRIDFQGPQDAYSLLSTGDGSSDRGISADSGTIRIEVSADNHDDISIEGKEIYAVPSVDT